MLIKALEIDIDLIDLFFSWGSGANPWGPEKDDQFSKPNHWDGMLEVVGVTGVVHLGQIQSGLRTAMRIAQVSGPNCKSKFANGPIYYFYRVDILKFTSTLTFLCKWTANHGYKALAML